MADITIYTKTDVNRTITFLSNSVAMDITGSTNYFTVKKDLNDDDDNTLVSTTLIITDAVNGVTTLTLTDLETDIPTGTYTWGILQKTSTGDWQPYGTGNFVVKKTVKQLRP